jgi:hypothetical protein
MIKFEEHEGLIFKMLEEPVPLTDDAELPVLVRLIQDDTMLGKANKRIYLPDKLAQKIICSSSKLTDDGLFLDRIYAYRYEIIGTLVEEGSDDWAWYQMMKGAKIKYSEMTSQRFYAIKEGCDYCAFYENDGTEVPIDTRRNYDEFIEYSKWLGTSSWQIYKEPKPEPQYKAGDFVEIRNWYSGYKHLAQIDSIDHEIHIGSHRFDTNGNSTMERLPQLKIIHKLKPSQVVVEIGCLSGTVRPVSTNGTHIWFHLVGVDDKTIATIRISCLDTPTRELVESLLEAQKNKETLDKI